MYLRINLSLLIYFADDLKKKIAKLIKSNVLRKERMNFCYYY